MASIISRTRRLAGGRASHGSAPVILSACRTMATSPRPLWPPIRIPPNAAELAGKGQYDDIYTSILPPHEKDWRYWVRKMARQPYSFVVTPFFVDKMWERAEDPNFRALGVPETFAATNALATLHMWIVCQRIRPEEIWQQKTLAQLFHMQLTMTEHKMMQVPGMSGLIITRELRRALEASYGSLGVYDLTFEHMKKNGDSGPFLAALFRNVFMGYALDGPVGKPKDKDAPLILTADQKKALNDRKPQVMILKTYIMKSLEAQAAIHKDLFYEGYWHFLPAPGPRPLTAEEQRELKNVDLATPEYLEPVFKNTKVRTIPLETPLVGWEKSGFAQYKDKNKR